MANEVSGTTTLFDIDTLTPDRLGGVDPYDTAAQIADGYPTGGDTAYIACGEIFPDVLVAAALAGTGADPVLLSRADRVPAVTDAALRRLAPERPATARRPWWRHGSRTRPESSSPPGWTSPTRWPVLPWPGIRGHRCRVGRYSTRGVHAPSMFDMLRAC